jgi:hypothetical protein
MRKFTYIHCMYLSIYVYICVYKSLFSSIVATYKSGARHSSQSESNRFTETCSGSEVGSLRGSQTLVSPSLRLEDLLVLGTRVKKKVLKRGPHPFRGGGVQSLYYHTVKYDPCIKSQLASRNLLAGRMWTPWNPAEWIVWSFT